MRRVPIEARFAFSCQSIGFETHTPLLTVSRRVPPDKLRIEGLFRVSGNKDMVEKLKLEYKNPNRTSDDADNGSRTHDLAYALTPPCYLVYRHSRHGQVQECARHRHDAQASTYTTIQFVVSRSPIHSFAHPLLRDVPQFFRDLPEPIFPFDFYDATLKTYRTLHVACLVACSLVLRHLLTRVTVDRRAPRCPLSHLSLPAVDYTHAAIEPRCRTVLVQVPAPRGREL